MAARPIARPLHLTGVAVDRAAEAVHRQLCRHRTWQAQRDRGTDRFDIDAAAGRQPGRCQIDAARDGFHRQSLHAPGVDLDPSGHRLRTDITGHATAGLDAATDGVHIQLRRLQACADAATDRVELAVATAASRAQAAADRVGLQPSHIDTTDVLAGADRAQQQLHRSRHVQHQRCTTAVAAARIFDLPAHTVGAFSWRNCRPSLSVPVSCTSLRSQPRTVTLPATLLSSMRPPAAKVALVDAGVGQCHGRGQQQRDAAGNQGSGHGGLLRSSSRTRRHRPPAGSVPAAAHRCA